MNWADGINGIYELTGGILLLLNCFRLYKDKKVRGITISAAAFFATWSCWNLYYYPSLNQWFSFCGGLLIVIANATWVIMAIYYTKKERQCLKK